MDASWPCGERRRGACASMHLRMRESCWKGVSRSNQVVEVILQCRAKLEYPVIHRL
jgi:hypothetical protein